MDINAEREKIRLEIQELERSLGPSLPCTEVQVSDSSLESASDDGDDLENGDGNSDSHVDMEVDPGGVKEADQEQEGGVVIYLPHTPETCLQMNLVYQEVIQEKMVEINLLLAQNKEQQEKLMWELAGTRGTKSGSRKTLPANMFLGHFMKPYFKDKTSGIGPPANSDAHEKARQGIKSFEELITIKWKSREKLLLRQSVLSDQLQHLLQPKLLKLDYLNEKREKAKDEVGRQIFEKQIQETEREITDINLLPEEALLGSKSDEHDWDKIANISFEGTRSGKELRKYWQNSEHPSINKKEWGEEELARLKEVAARHRFVGWEAVAQELGTRRTAFQCLQKFQAYNKDFKRSEWAPEEDQMLLHLVQEMRVGSHIPYRKIAYYMEGRNSAQLIYRWTKCVDPNLKRGAWTPREDALLLKAVAKYGPRDWYKIRAEVPGRTDTQCRDRYLHALHYDIKKGKWSEEEERKLVELTEKYGVGHWAKIAAELPHRSGSQCLSKWKVLLGYRGNRRKKQGNRLYRKRRRAQREDLWETSSEDSELELELELGEGGSTEEEDEAPRPRAEGHWRVPSIDLWVPARRSPLGAQPEELPSVTLLSKGFDVNREQKPLCRAFPDGQEHAAAEGSGGGILQPEQGHVQDGLSEEGNGPSVCPKDSWRVSLAYVKSVLRRNSYELQRRSREITRKKRFLSAAQAGPERSIVPTASRPYGNPRPKDGMWKTTLYRRLMMAIAPWAGSAVQAWALQVKAEASRKSKVELISKQLQTAHLASTPVFTLLIQLLRIDVNGCMKVIQKRRAPQSELLKAVAANTGKEQPLAKAPLAQNAKAQHSLQTSAPHPGKRLVPLKAKEGPAPASSRAARCSGSAPKPKTVSELLREKRLREAKVKKAEQRRLLLTAPPLLLPSSVIIRPQGPPAAQGLSSLQGTPSGQVSLLPAALPVAASTPPVPPSEMDRVPPQATSRNVCETAVVSRERADAPRNGAPHGHRGATPPSQANASFPAPQASVGGPPGPSPSLDPAGTGDPSSSSSSPAAAAAAAAPQPGSGALPKAVLPITWVLTPQGLIPMTIVSLPSQGKLPVGAPGAPPQLGQGTVATSPQAPAVGAVLATGGSSQAPPGARVQERLSGSPQPSGVVQQAASAPSSQPLPAHPRGLSESLPTTCPPASPSHGASSRSTRPVSPAGAAPALAHPSQVVGNPPPLAPPQPGKAPPGPEAQPPAPHEHKLSPDYGLLSQEDPAAVKGWVSAGAAAHLPCLPPFLCSLRTVGALLLNKEALERTAAPLVAPGGRPDGLGQAGLSALRGLVRQQLGANPAYQLLRSRFLAAFTFPAALAALPPCRVTTTLSGGRWWESSSGEDSSPSEEGEEEEEEEEEEDDDNDEAAEESQKTTLDEPGRTADTSKEQEETNTDRAASVPWSTPTFRRSTRLRKRRRQL
ncbi:snRNA-activating protein complex subunit 4 [Varanus komodoensis]|uniref:snRNA-activating protein complex subunit 4 n=1 Tax=Varanus komodoensis TaxID=61221 RepID=UPI001CF76A0D|nr:snRNA-activating protein complex subunit 4 [Varanus komodoensis]XP_044309096.1 snRNA-activating protein complex subunit 4 [Varanus komodoensis]XP_044309097.1 snRNA-activating protein complex subunit 4 [Varanus komodoensis]